MVSAPRAAVHPITGGSAPGTAPMTVAQEVRLFSVLNSMEWQQEAPILKNWKQKWPEYQGSLIGKGECCLLPFFCCYLTNKFTFNINCKSEI